MIKVVALLKRKDGLSREEFCRYWHDEHAPLGERIVPKDVLSRRYVQNHAVQVGKKEPAYDAVAELGFADEAGLRRWNDWYAGPDGKALRDDEEKFIDTAARVILIVDEHVMW